MFELLISDILPLSGHVLQLHTNYFMRIRSLHILFTDYCALSILYTTNFMAGDNRCSELQSSVDFSKVNRSLLI